MGIACPGAPSSVDHNSLPVLESKARILLSSVPETNRRPLAVAVKPPDIWRTCIRYAEGLEFGITAQRHLPGNVARLGVNCSQQTPRRLLTRPIFFRIPESRPAAVPADIREILRVDKHVRQLGIISDARP